MPEYIHIVIGGIMLFTAAAVRRFLDSTLLMQCIDDLETLYGNNVFLWGGLKESALYNQDWLFCWCLQVRMKGRVVFDALLDDVDFPQRKCLRVADAARSQMGIHHTNPKRVRALWRAHQRSSRREGRLQRSGELNASADGAIDDPAQPVRCMLSSGGDPGDATRVSDHRYLDSFRRPVKTSECRSLLKDRKMQKLYPHCRAHMAYVKDHPSESPCFGVLGRKRCEGFQLDPADLCNVQYYLFCERLFKTATQSWCPAPEGYPQHCCYAEAIKEMDGAQKIVPRNYLLQVFPDQPAFTRKNG